jgi:hypothetical protein
VKDNVIRSLFLWSHQQWKSVEKLGTTDVIVAEASAQIAHLLFHRQHLPHRLLLRPCIELEKLLSQDDFFDLQTSDERPNVGVSFVHAFVETTAAHFPDFISDDINTRKKNEHHYYVWLRLMNNHRNIFVEKDLPTVQLL